jgi:hypothetical protein
VFTADLAASFLSAAWKSQPTLEEHYFGSATRIGGADRARTDDPLLAKQVLSQLSYSPRLAFGSNAE